MSRLICSQCHVEGHAEYSNGCIINIIKDRNTSVIDDCQWRPVNEAIDKLWKEILRVNKCFKEYTQQTLLAYDEYKTVSDEYMRFLLEYKGKDFTEETFRIKQMKFYAKEAANKEYNHLNKITMGYNDSLTELLEEFDIAVEKLKQGNQRK
jgi:hypothetical protein